MGSLLQGQVAIVTGAGRGIGRAVAVGLAAEGASVVVNDLGVEPDGRGGSERPAHQVAEEIAERGGVAVPDLSDIATFDGGAGVVRTALQTFGRVDILVNNAGIFRHSMLYEMPPEDWDAIMNVHLRGHFSCIRAAIPHMREQGYGRIVNTSSGVGALGLPGSVNYGAAKAAIIGLTRAVAAENAELDIVCNAVAPAAETRAILDVLPGVTKMLSEHGIPAGMRGGGGLPKPESIVPAMVYLASEHASAFNGQLFHIAGGFIQRAAAERPVRSVVVAETLPTEALDAAVRASLLAR